MILNPDEKVVNAIQNRLKVTNGQCPCVPPYLQSEDTICPCKAYREEQHCCCNLYVETVTNTENLQKSIMKLLEESKKKGLTMQDLADAVKKLAQENNLPEPVIDIEKIERHTIANVLIETQGYVDIRSAISKDTYVFYNGSEKLTVIPTNTINICADINDESLKDFMNFKNFTEGISECIIDFIQEYMKTNKIIATPKCVKMVIENFIIGDNGNIEINVGLGHFKQENGGF